jgi:hypothetical protein
MKDKTYYLQADNGMVVRVRAQSKPNDETTAALLALVKAASKLKTEKR